MYTGQAFLSLEKLLRWVWSDNPIMGTTVGPVGKAFYQGTEWAVSTRKPLQELVRTYLIPAYPTTSPPYASLNIIAPHLTHILE